MMTITISYSMGISTVWKISKDVFDVLRKCLMSVVMSAPNHEICGEIAACIDKQWNFLHCCGAFDDKQTMLQATANSGSLFFHYKCTFLIVLIFVADSNYKFIIVDIGHYGFPCDGGIFAKANFLQKALQRLPGCPTFRTIAFGWSWYLMS